MEEKKKNLSDFNSFKLPSLQNITIGIIVSEWNDFVTEALKEGAISTLLEFGLKKEQIEVYYVPGSFELPTAAVMLLEAHPDIDGIICLGCVIQGETRHFEFISQAVATGIMKIGVEYSSPVIFGVLTCDTIEQAKERSGGKHGNKGVEAAVSCLKMLALERKLK